ncbi:MAG: hypothetical protein M1828_002223 [Chrysothrix sp. TS-e1954]|nr:MAG: hypothetical protein M1828_002223 [Chrysothrix sp. TS-e1954]
MDGKKSNVLGSHRDGLFSLLRLGDPDSFQTGLELSLLRHLMAYFNLYLMNSPNDETSSSAPYIRQYRQLLDPQHPNGRAKLALLKTTKLGKVLRTSLNNGFESPSSHSEVVYIVCDIESTDTELSRWSDGISDDWKCRTVRMQMGMDEKASSISMNPLVYSDHG